MLFRVSTNYLSIGDLIDPGWHGAQYRAYKPGGAYPMEPNFTSLLIEIALESARKAAAPNAPSRLDCVFTCETLAHASHFNSAYRGGRGIIFGVEAVDQNAPKFRGNFSAISTPSGNAAYVDYLSDWARGYWTEEPTEIVEVLVGGRVRVVTEPLNFP